MNCTWCQRDLPLGASLLIIVPGVLGNHGVITFDDDRTVFCSDSCLERHVAGVNEPERPA